MTSPRPDPVPASKKDRSLLGTLWADNDDRERVANHRQHLEVIDEQLEAPYDPKAEPWVELHDTHTAKRTRVLVRRLRPTSTGYRRIESCITCSNLLQASEAADATPT